MKGILPALQVIASKTIRMVAVLFLISGGCNILLLSSCNTVMEDDALRKTDTLIKWNTQAGETLVIDPEAVSARTDSMKIKLSVLKEKTKNIENEELRFNLNEYEGLLKHYENFLEKYESFEFDNLRYKALLEGMKKDIIDKKLNPGDFEKNYTELRNKIKTHRDDVKNAVGKIASVEEMYQRLSNYLNPLYIKQIKNNQ